jgi:hypothetical protein
MWSFVLPVSTLGKEAEENACHKYKGQQESNHDAFDHWSNDSS